MSIINNSKNFIFIHVPKAAGTSVTKVLSKYTTYLDLEIGGTHFGESIQPAYSRRFNLSKHIPSGKMKQVIGENNYNDKFTFSFVRNPYDRVVSTYKFLMKWENSPVELKERIKKFKDVNEYVLSDIWFESDGPDQIFKPQAFWLTDINERQKIIVDYIGKLENLYDDLLYVVQKIDAKVTKLDIPNLNAITGEHKLSSASIKKINEFYHRDFKLFGYQKD